MSVFQGHFNVGQVENHIFYSNNPEMEAIGLHSFTLHSYYRIWNSNLPLIKFALAKDDLVLISPAATGLTEQTIFDDVGGLKLSPAQDENEEQNQDNQNTQTDVMAGEYTIWNQSTQSFETKSDSYANWKSIIKYYKDITYSPSTTTVNDSYDKIIKNVKTSMNGAVKFNFAASLLYSSASATDTIDVFLKFLDRKPGDKDDSDNRVVGIGGNIPIVDIAQTPAGTRYNATDSTTKASPSTAGKKSGLYDGGIDNPKNTIAATPDYYLNSFTGKFESGNRRVLAVLLSDIDPAPLQKIDVDATSLNNLKPNDFTNKNSSAFTPYSPTTGIALPLYVQHNNPHLFAPNFIKKCKRAKDGTIIQSGYFPESLVVTNRFNRSFTKGTTVFLTRIGGEWIPEEQTQTELKAGLKTGDWTFTKLIADSDNYFKDNRFFTNGTNSNTITPSDYESATRYKFYSNLNTLFAASTGYNIASFYPATTNYAAGFASLTGNNLQGNYNTDFQPSKRYYISTIFDQLPASVGGFSPSGLISRTNLNQGTSNGSDSRAKEVGVFWGPVFTEGYKNTIKDTSTDNDDVYFKNYANITANDPTAGLVPSYNLTGSLGQETYNPTRQDVPAECTSKILDTLFLIKNYHKIGTVGLTGVIPQHLNTPYLKSGKTSTNNVQFIPLTANLVGHDDINAGDGTNDAFTSYERNFYNRMKEFFTNHLRQTLSTNAWGNMFSRKDTSFITTYNPLGTNKGCVFKSGYTQKINASKNLVVYDCYITRDPTDPPVGNPQLLFDDPALSISRGANCVGIICGKNTINKRSGGLINFSVTSNFGFAPYSAVTPGQFQLSILPIGLTPVALLTSSEVRSLPGVAQFGSYEDNIYSFGTTALFIRIFDSWPDSQTLFDPRYFGVLHFNPGNLGTNPRKDDNGIYYEDSPVDFRVPTNTSDTIIATGTKVGRLSTTIADYNKSQVNTIRRGMLLTGGGFTYYKRQIGVFDSDITVQFSGAKYEQHQVFDVSNDLKIKVLTTNPTNGGILTVEAWAVSGQKEYGNFSYKDLPTTVTIPPPKDSDGKTIPGAEAAVLALGSGTVYDYRKIDLPPTEQVPLTRISSSSKAGKSEVFEEIVVNEFDLQPNSAGQYDIFTHFHNDITHSVLYNMFGDAKFQHITMKMS